MREPSLEVVGELVIRKDTTKSADISYEQFRQVINFLHSYKEGRYAFSKLQAFLMYCGMSGFRPGHIRKADLSFLVFSDRARPRLGVIDTKKVPKRVFVNGVKKCIFVRYEEWDEHDVALWVRDYFEEYIRRNWMTMVNGVLFPSKDGRLMKTTTWDVLVGKLRKTMYEYDPIKYAWVNDVIRTDFNGIDKKTGVPRKLKKIHRLSLYPFRRGNITWYSLALLDKGISDVPLHAAKYAGHSPKGQHHIYRYIQRLLAERANGDVSLLKPPNLNENFLGVENPSTEVDRIISALMQHPRVREAVAHALKGINTKNRT